jgi:hypothetical protein
MYSNVCEAFIYTHFSPQGYDTVASARRDSPFHSTLCDKPNRKILIFADVENLKSCICIKFKNVGHRLHSAAENSRREVKVYICVGVSESTGERRLGCVWWEA